MAVPRVWAVAGAGAIELAPATGARGLLAAWWDAAAGEQDAPGGRAVGNRQNHLLRIFAKLGVDDRTAAVTVALERGIIRLPG